VPRVFEKVYNAAKQKAHDGGKGKIFDAAAETAIAYSEAVQGGGPDLFLKAVFPPFHAEPVLTRLLAERFPETVPTVVAVEPDEGWLIVEDIGSAWVGDVPEADRPALFFLVF